jgi:signal transduction histidine kinase
MRAEANLRRPLPKARGGAPLVWRIFQVQLVVCGLLAIGLLLLISPGRPLSLADRVGGLAACALAAALAAAVLAPTILRPVARLADLAERCARDRQAGGSDLATGLAANPDEIGRLATAIRRMAAVLYNRIDSNEHFAADVAHEIRTPLASLHGAVGVAARGAGRCATGAAAGDHRG